MKKIKIYFLLTLSFLFFNVCLGQTELTEKERVTFKEKVLEKANNTNAIASDFTQSKWLEMLAEPVVSEGKLVFKAPDLILWQYISPKAYKVIFKDEMLYVENDGKKDEIKLSSNGLFKSFNALIVNSIKGNMFDENEFEISYFKTTENFLVKFLPKDKRMKRFVSAFELTFNKTTGEVAKIKLVEPNNDYTFITFSNRKTNVEIPSTTFNH